MAAGTYGRTIWGLQVDEEPTRALASSRRQGALVCCKYHIAMTTTNTMELLLGLPPSVLEKMGFKRPLGAPDSQDDAAISATMLRQLIFGDEDAAAGGTTSGGGSIEGSLSVGSSPHTATDPSPPEVFAMSHPDGPQFFVRDGFLGTVRAQQVRSSVVQLHECGALGAAKMGRGSRKVRAKDCSPESTVHDASAFFPWWGGGRKQTHCA